MIMTATHVLIMRRWAAMIGLNWRPARLTVTTRFSSVIEGHHLTCRGIGTRASNWTSLRAPFS